MFPSIIKNSGKITKITEIHGLIVRKVLIRSGIFIHRSTGLLDLCRPADTGRLMFWVINKGEAIAAPPGPKRL